MFNSPDVVIRIKSYAKEKNISIKDLLAACELGVNTLSHMNHGKAIAFDSLAKIADYLGCSVDYLLGKTDIPQTIDDQLANEQFALYGEVKDLTDEEKEAVLNFIKFTKAQREQK